jgi:putative transposase
MLTCELPKTNKESKPMTVDVTMTLMNHLRQLGVEQDPDFLREAIQVLMQGLIELEVSEQIGANRYERNAQRTTQRNGYRKREYETRVGEIDLHIPKLRQGTYFPSLLTPRRRSEKALLAVIQQAYIAGVSTRKVDDLVKAMGLSGVDKSKVSRICQQLDEVVQHFRQRPFEQAYPYVWLDALYLKVRQNHRIVSLAVVIAIGVRDTGERDVLGFEVGASEEESFWLAFLRGLVERGVKGVQLVISDAHSGLKAAIGAVFHGASWQRCRVHFMRNILALIPKADKAMVAALLRTIFAQPNCEAAAEQVRLVCDLLDKRWPKAAQRVRDAEDDILAYMAFPAEHWKRIYSNNPLERLNKEVKRRTNVVGVFPDVPSVFRLVGAVLIEIDDEWQAATRRYFSQESMRKLDTPEPEMLMAAVAPTLPPVA